MHTEGSKQCSRCRATKPRTDFNVRRRAYDGLRAECRACQKADAAKYRVKNSDKLRAYRAENAFRRVSYQREYYDANQETLRQDAIQRYNRNRIARKESTRRYREANRDRARVWYDTRRARKHEAFVESVERLVVLERDDGVCGICGEDVDPFAFHVDHIIPLARGGEHSYGNVQVAHPRCNMSKRTRII